MSANDLQAVADQLVELARQQGYVVAREAREALIRAGLPESRWKEALALTRPSLSYRRGRYHFPDSHDEITLSAGPTDISQAVREVLEFRRTDVSRVERREQGRVDFVHPVVVITEDQRRYTVLTRDLSATGIRLIGTHRFLGQKLRVLLPASPRPLQFVVRIVWTCPVGEDLIENGGTFLAVEPTPEPPPPQN